MVLKKPRSKVPPEPLDAHQKTHLRRLGHGLDPVVQIGKSGLSEAVMEQLRAQFAAHELLKVKLAAKATVELDEVAERIPAETGARLVQRIGRVLLLYRPHDDPDDRRIQLPKKKPKAEEPATD